jgi:hypothetical protein
MVGLTARGRIRIAFFTIQKPLSFLHHLLRMKRALLALSLILLVNAAEAQFSLVKTSPQGNTSAVPINSTVTIEFSDVVAPTSVETGFSIMSGLAGVIEFGTSVSGKLVTLTPTSTFLRSDVVTVTIFSSIKSIDGVALAGPATFQFTIAVGASNEAPPGFLDHDVGIVANWIGSADMDGDKDIDIVYVGSRVGWLENNGKAKFVNHDIMASNNVLGASIICDIDRDGHLDIVTTGWSGIGILINDGAQNFSTAATIPGNSVAYIDIADFDYNGLLDIVYYGRELVNDAYIDGTYILYNNGSTVFDKVKISSQASYKSRCGDIDNDGDVDIVQYQDHRVSVLVNNDATFTSHDIFNEEQTDIMGFTLVDLNNDQFLDLLVSTYKSYTLYTEAWLSDGTLVFEFNSDSILSWSGLTCGDFDGDGDQDIIGTEGDYIFSMQENDGSAKFIKRQVALDPVSSPGNVVSGDFDGDGDLDLAVPAFNAIKYYENSVLPFKEILPSTVKTLTHGDSDWGDFDNDGDYDLVITGNDEPNLISTVYRNDNGNLQFYSSLQGLYLSSCDWGDYDNDGDLDILLAGASTMTPEDRKPMCLVYTNEDGSFIPLESSAQQLPKFYEGEARWADFDNDGWLDIAMSGNTFSGLYRSDGRGNFFWAYDFPMLTQGGNIDVSDFDGDGDTDIVVGGGGVFRNNGNWTFSSIGGDIIGRLGGTINWADMDNDGDRDLVVGGPLFSSGSVNVYENQDSLFTRIENTDFLYQADYEGTIAAGDFDNDGLPDVLGSRGGYPPAMTILKNSGHGVLIVEHITLPAIATKAGNWVDFDNDHDLDIFAGGKLVRNNVMVENVPPVPPEQIQVDSVYNNSIYLSWDLGDDFETGSSGISYQIYVGKQSHTQDVVNANSDLSTGFRRTVVPGNTIGPHTWVTNLYGGTYYFGVQSIDASFEGSPFSVEGEVLVIGIHGPTAACKGFESSYVTSSTGEYTWQVTGGTISSGQGSDSVVIRWNSVGKGLLGIRNNKGDRNTLEVFIDLKPNPQIVGDATVCTGEQVYEVVDSLSFSTDWTTTAIDEMTMADRNKAKISWSESGEYIIVGQSFPEHFGCFTYDTLKVSVDKRPLPSISGPDMSCANRIEQYTAESISPMWTAVNGTIGEHDEQSIHVEWTSSEIPGRLYLLERSEREFCESYDSLQVTVYPLPEVPTLTRSYDTLWSSPSPNGFYKWYYNGSFVQGGSYNAAIPNVSGVFVVEVFSWYSCGRKSNPFNYIITGIDDAPLESTFAFYPNPADTRLFFELTDSYLGHCEAEIYSVTGQLVKQLDYVKLDQMLSGEIDVSVLDAGVYILNIKTNDAVHKRRIVIK